LGEKQDQRLKALALVLKALSHETRLRILNLLHENQKTWNEMQLELKLNPKSLRDHLKYLLDRNLVKRIEPVGFDLTYAGRIILEISMKEMLAVVELDD
jgi:predicted transcriptional regulator